MAEDIEAQKQQERVAHEAVQIASNGVNEVEDVAGSPSKPAFEEVDINGGEVEQERSGEVKQETPVSGTDKPLPSPSTQVLLSPPSGKATEEMQDVPLASSAPTPEPPSPAAHPPATPAKDHAVPRASQSVTSLQHFDSRPTTPGRTGSAVGGHTRQSSTHTLSLSTRPSTSSGPQLSSVLIIPGLQTIAHSKEAKRSPALLQAATRALELCQNNAAFAHPREIFEPLRLACETRVEKLVIPSLDLLSKLIAHSFFQEPNGPPPNEPPIADLIAHSITICYVESSPAPVALQVIKALLALVLSPAILVHQSSLLKAVRTIYNIFLLSPDATNQMVAQGGLTQMVQHVFGRVPRGKNATRPSSAMDANASEVGSEQHSVSPSQARRSSAKTDRGSVSSPAPVAEDHAVNGGEGQVDSSDSGTKPEDADGHAPPTAAKENAVDAASDAHSKDRLTLDSFALPNPNDTIPVQAVQGEGSIRVPETTVSIPVPGEALDLDGATIGEPQDHPNRPISTGELFVKDAFLVFRALCKLTMKPLLTESERDLRSHEMRSKLLSLQLVLTILQSHSDLFADPNVSIPSTSSNESTPFLQATKQYLCLSLSRNALSPVIQVFELSIEIFWRVLNSLRAQMKKEIEVLFNEIFLPILEMRHATLRQKSLLLGVYQRLCQDPQALVEIYINYDCDRTAVENIYERLVNIIARIGQTHFAPPSKAEEAAAAQNLKQTTAAHGPTIPGTLAASSLAESAASQAKYAHLTPEQKLKRQSLECLVAVLKSLVAWGTAGSRPGHDEHGRSSEDVSRLDVTNGELMEPRMSISGAQTPDVGGGDDEVEKFESAKQKKTSLLEGIKKFNFKPKRGIQFLLEHGFIKSSKSEDVARFLLRTDGLSKAMIGEYLGEADETNIATMHAFVDMLDFTGLTFTEAIRLFLQSFRLPGEAQKIDRFVLKFAERYIACNPSTEFANADTAYILAFSVIMLNTDAHNKNLKTKRMTKAEFVKNNRGINDGKDLAEDFLGAIYDDIQTNEIRMKDEIELVLASPVAGGLAGTLANVGRDLQREAYVAQSEGMVNKTEALFRTLIRQQRRGGKYNEQFYSASNLQHVRPMFEVAWMPFLAAISGPLQETEDMDVVLLCLDGFKHAIKIVCIFDLELERNAFVSTLAKFTFLNNLAEMKPKNVEAIKALLDIAISDGNNLKGSWREVLTCVSQLERMQLISSGMDVPDLHRRDTANGRSKTTVRRRAPAENVAEEGRSSQVTVAADMVFSMSKNLSGSAIVHFVQALSEVSWEEIQSSSQAQQPRLFSLQKLVEISYYNMGRIRLEWSNIWAILGDHFNQVCCHNNPNVSFFALDALRQLAMRFLEKDELSHFRFQKDFLRPFEYTMTNNTNGDAREMVLQCMQQMLQARVQNLRSGWRTMFAVFSAASRVTTERVVNYGFDLVSLIYKEHFALVVRYGSFADLTVCVTDFSKVTKFQKISLQAIDMLRGMVSKMLQLPETALPVNPQEDTKVPLDDPMAKYWFPVLFSFYDIIMTGADLEVRRLALDCLFDTLKTHGAGFRIDFWESICREVLFPIFAVLNSSADVSRFSTQEDMSVWLSTTMISALRNLISLYTYYFETLQRFLDGLLDLLCACICQENDTLARIGTACFQQLLENNVRKLSPEKWERVVSAFVQLFKTTTAHQLFDEALRSEKEAPPTEHSATGDDSDSNLVAPAPLTPVDPNAQVVKPVGAITAAERRKAFKQIIVKCVLQLLLIETTHELLQNDEVYNTIPAEHLLRFMTVLDDSYQFARKFNADKELRMALWKVGFMKQLPNLLKQESSSAATLVNVLLRMYDDPRPEHRASRGGVLKQFMPLGTDVMRDFNAIDAETQPRNITAWTPVVTEILQGCCRFEDDSFNEYLPQLYPLVTDMLSRDMAVELWQAVREFYVRVGQVQGLMERRAE